jgi:deoxyribodipyrimidine photo-lyase
MPNSPEVPEEIARLMSHPRVRVRQGGPTRKGGRCIVYWMQRAMRIADNPALDVAIEAGNLLGMPVVAFFSVIPNYPNANLRHYHFMAQGLRDVAEEAAERGVGFVLRRHPDNSIEAFLEEVDAALLVGDENPCREPERWRKVLAKRLKIPFWTVDADVVVPSRLFTRGFYAQHLFRRQLGPLLSEYIAAPKVPKLEKAWSAHTKIARWPLDDDITRGWRHFDRSVKPVDTFRGGAHAAAKRLRYFAEQQLASYESARRKPEVNGTSQL